MFELTNAVIVDTETTGVDNKAQICEIGMIDALTGDILLSTLVKPTVEIPQGAIDVHGISNEMVADAPCWRDIFGHYLSLVRGKKIYAYNAKYDERLVKQTSEIHNIPGLRYPWVDVMVPYSDMYGEPNRRYPTQGRWQKLTNAAAQQGIDISDLQAHRATSDCEITRRLMAVMNRGKEAIKVYQSK